MENQKYPPNYYSVMQLCTGFANVNVIYTLVKSGVIEQMRNSEKTLEEITSSGKYNPNVLFRLLRYAAAIGLVSLNDNTYSLTDNGKFLLKDVSGSMYYGVMLFGAGPWHRSWNNLMYSLETGKPAFEHTMGEPFFSFLNLHPQYGEPFDKWMSAVSDMASKAIVEAYNFSPYKTVCDIGGGRGSLLKEILDSNAHLKGILYDQESVVNKHVLGDMLERVEIKPGNFFESVPSADVLMMKTIVHDWDDDKSLIILSTCKKQMKPNTKLLIIETVIDNTTDLIGLFFDLHMQVITAGRERTESEFRQLLERAGMKLNRIIATKSMIKIIEATL